MADYTRCSRTKSVILIGILIINFIAAKSEDIVLLDTTKTRAGAYLNWTSKTVTANPPDTSNKGWNEVSTYIQPISDDPLKVYTSCYVSSHQVNNWLRTPYIAVDRAESLYLNMTFTMRKCVRHSDPSSLQQCRETLNLYSYEAAKDIANNEMPSWDDTSYTLVNKIPAKILSEETTDVLLNSETRFIPLKRLQGIYFAFQDEGACVTLVALKIYYKVCPYTIFKYATFPVTPTGPTSSSSVETVGTCVANSSQVQKPIYRCMSDGTWDIPLGMCQCDPGYSAVDGEKCVACHAGYFKWQVGNFACSPCPNNSYTLKEHSIECTCMDHFFRAYTDDKSMPCTKPPSEPRDLRVTTISYTSVTLSWNPPADLGGRFDVTYQVECLACGSNVMVSPKSSGFNSTSVELTQLIPSTSYMVTIYSRNGITSLLTALPLKYVNVNFTTDSFLAEIQNIEEVNVGDRYISLTWEVMGDPLTQAVVLYEVNYSIRGQQSSNSTFTETNSITLKELLKDTVYAIKVRGKTLQKGWGEYSPTYYCLTQTSYIAKNELESSPSTGIIVGAIVAVTLCTAIAIIMILLLLKRNIRNDGKSSEIDGPYHHVTVPLFQPTGSIKSYVDPHTYEDPNQAVREFTREIDASHITIESVIGGGEFGDVCKGKLRIPSRLEMTVAIKTLKPGATDKNRLDFLTEASIMGQFDDPNVIFLEGVITKASPIMIVTEYMANGSLNSFLKNNDGQLTVIQLVGMLRGIASGMRYLSEMGYVHRDLAARNILCNESLVCKVADFGLSREVDIDTIDGAYTTKGGKIPVRWTAPEAIAFRKFTTASDVWSFGVVMWEVISYGERPYWNWPNQDVIKAVEKGYRLPPPMECPEAIYNLVLEMWHKDRNNRPKFVNIVKSLDKLIRSPELLRKMAKPRLQVYMDNSPPEVSNFTSVEDWLNSIKMERYRDNFATHAITGMDQVTQLTAKDLNTLDIKLLGHQKRIMSSVQNLHAHLLGHQVQLPQVQVSEGFLV